MLPKQTAYRTNISPDKLNAILTKFKNNAQILNTDFQYALEI